MPEQTTTPAPIVADNAIGPQIDQLRAVARVLTRNDGALRCVRTDNGTSCIRNEGRRRLTADERGGGSAGALRSYDLYDPDKLCLSCRAYWYTQQAINALQRLSALSQRYTQLPAGHEAPQ